MRRAVTISTASQKMQCLQVNDAESPKTPLAAVSHNESRRSWLGQQRINILQSASGQACMGELVGVLGPSGVLPPQLPTPNPDLMSLCIATTLCITWQAVTIRSGLSRLFVAP